MKISFWFIYRRCVEIAVVAGWIWIFYAQATGQLKFKQQTTEELIAENNKQTQEIAQEFKQFSGILKTGLHYILEGITIK